MDDTRKRIIKLKFWYKTDNVHNAIAGTIQNNEFTQEMLTLAGVSMVKTENLEF